MIDKLRIAELQDIVETLINFNILAHKIQAVGSKKNRSIKLSVDLEELT